MNVSATEQASGGDRRADHRGIQVIHRAAEILRTMHGNDETGLSLAQIAQRIGLPRSTVHRILTALESERFVTKAGVEGYQLGTGLMDLARRSDQDRLFQAIHPFVVRLANDLDETAALAAVENGYSVFIMQAPTRSAVRAEYPAGSTMPL